MIKNVPGVQQYYFPANHKSFLVDHFKSMQENSVSHKTVRCRVTFAAQKQGKHIVTQKNKGSRNILTQMCDCTPRVQ